VPLRRKLPDRRRELLLILTPTALSPRLRGEGLARGNDRSVMWQPITDPRTTSECWTTIREIERALTDSLENGSRRNPAMAGGDAGIALFLSYLHASGTSETAGDHALEALGMSLGALAERRLLPTLYTGFFGVGWVVTHLTRELFEGDADLAAEVDEALRHLLAETSGSVPFELIGGLAGYGTYLVERLPDPGAATLLHEIVNRLTRSRDASGVWFSDPAWLPDWQRELMPAGYHNAGVAHGIPGVIGFLAAAWREGFRDPRIPQLAADAVRWTLAQRDDSLEGSVFPAHVPPDGDPRPTRTAWCYGDLGIAAVLLSAAQSFERDDWREHALDIARVAARRPFEDTKTVDVGLCHGATGIAHIFNRVYQATGDEEMRDAAHQWIRRALALRRPGEGVAGFLSWMVMPPAGGEWVADRGFLTGAAGIGLALLAAVSDVEPSWDRVMLVSVPPASVRHEVLP